MTTVVGYAPPGGVWMAADTRTNIYDRPIDGFARKILRLTAGDATALLGVCGHAGIVAQIRRLWPQGLLAPPTRPENLQAWAEDISSQLTTAMVEAGIVEEGRMEGHVLLGIPGTLWTISHHLAILCPDGRGAVGSGESPAMGALDALLRTDITPYEAVKAAAEIAVARDRWSGLPLQLEFTEQPGQHDTPVARVVAADRIARRFHETYERLAPEHGYTTREASAKPWPDVPERNRRLMVATVQALIDSGDIRI